MGQLHEQIFESHIFLNINNFKKIPGLSIANTFEIQTIFQIINCPL